jgi:hypothetical protein
LTKQYYTVKRSANLTTKVASLTLLADHTAVVHIAGKTGYTSTNGDNQHRTVRGWFYMGQQKDISEI